MSVVICYNLIAQKFKFKRKIDSHVFSWRRRLLSTSGTNGQLIQVSLGNASLHDQCWSLLSCWGLLRDALSSFSKHSGIKFLLVAYRVTCDDTSNSTCNGHWSISTATYTAHATAHVHMLWLMPSCSN